MESTCALLPAHLSDVVRYRRIQRLWVGPSRFGIDQSSQDDYLEGMSSWPLAKAKAKLSELVEQAMHHEPQQITKNGRPVAIVLSIADWKKKQGPGPSRPNFAEFFRKSPLVGSGIDLRRKDDAPRSINL